MRLTTKRIGSYDLTLTAMMDTDIPRLHELSMAVGWPHRPQDWKMVQTLGEGIVARDEIGRLAGSAMLFPMGGDLVHIGMVITSPRLQEQGTGRWLMKEMLHRSNRNVRMLNATKTAYRLYLALGFQSLTRVMQRQGVARLLPGEDARVRPMAAADISAVLALDIAAFGSDRSHVLRHVLPLSQGVVLEEAGAVQGFALCRPFGGGHVIGPIIARDEAAAIALIRPHVNARVGQFLRVDTRQSEGVLGTALDAAGLAVYDHVTTMSLGTPPPRDGPFQNYGLITHALG